jgi:hypothetical protein
MVRVPLPHLACMSLLVYASCTDSPIFLVDDDDDDYLDCEDDYLDFIDVIRLALVRNAVVRACNNCESAQHSGRV